MKKTIVIISAFLVFIQLSINSFSQRQWIDSVMKNLSTLAQDTNRMLTLINIGNYYSFNEPDSGIIYAKEALALSEKLQNDAGIFWSIVCLDHSLYVTGNYSLELEYALKALPIAGKLNDQNAIGWSNGMICDSYLNLGDYRTAMIYVRAVFKVMRESNPNELFSGYANVVPVYIGLHEYDSALFCAKKSLELLKANPRLYNEKRDEGKYARSQVYLYLGQAYGANASYDSALYYYRLCLPIMAGLNQRVFEIDAWGGMAGVFKSTNKPDSAIAYARKMLAQKVIGSYPAGMLKAASLLADVYESKKISDSSLKYLRITLNLKDSLYNRGKTTAFQNALLKDLEKKAAVQAATTALQNRYRFYLGIGLLVASLTIAGIVIRNRRTRQLEKIRNSIADDLHDDIGSTLSSIGIMSELAKSRSTEATPLLTSISENTFAMQENMNDIVWALKPGNDRFENVLQRMNQFAAEILEAKNIALDFEGDPSLTASKLAMAQRRSFYFFFKEAINNAAKHSGAEKITVRITQKDHYADLKICDNGRGFDNKKPAEGNGMNTLKKRAAELGAQLSITSALNKGTTLHLRFKII